MLLGILILAFKQIFNPKNQDDLYAQSCINILDWEINNFINSAMTNKQLYYQEEKQQASQYFITIQEATWDIILSFNTGLNQTKNIYKNYKLDGAETTKIHCNTSKYKVQMDGINTREIAINWGFENKNSIPFFIKKEENRMLTWQTIFTICNIEGNYCKEIAKIEYDSRSKSISKKLCLSRENTTPTLCQQRDN